MLFNFSQISMEDLFICNQRGWIPGPNELEKQFFERIKVLRHFMDNPPQEIDLFITDSDWEKVQEKLKSIFDIRPDWIIAYYSNQGLHFFQGAATWIVEKNNVKVPLIQLKEKFMSGSLWKIYDQEEVLAHEAVHAVRMQFDEPFFEEFFAYKTSSHFLRRFFGPIFQKPWESTLCIFFLCFPFVAFIFQNFFEKTFWWDLISLVPLIYLGFLSIRLICFHLVLSFACFRLRYFQKDAKKIWATALRLTDREIIRCAFSKRKTLDTFFKMQKDLRWKLLKKNYLKPL